MSQSESILPHLFRTEYRKIVSVLCRTFGLRDVETAEDIASETFLTAAQTWGIQGMPPNPTAWLYTVARNKTSNHLKRRGVFDAHVSEGYRDQRNGYTALVPDLSDEYFEDSQLQLMFALCHPSIPVAMQVALCLRLLCGFGVGEIADAFLTDRQTISKRLLRAKERLRNLNVPLEMPPEQQLHARIDGVLTTIYLLFNEGYYSDGADAVLRRDLCLEAVRLTAMLLERGKTNVPEVNALMALMCFHFSRFDSRIDASGGLVLYDEQDSVSWNVEWVVRGGYFLQRAGTGNHVTTYHLEAAIAWYHTATAQDKWENILRLYDQLLQIKPSPVVHMSRAYALYKVSGSRQARAALEGVELNDSHLYQALLGQLWMSEDRTRARRHFVKAFELAKSPAVKTALQKKIELCTGA